VTFAEYRDRAEVVAAGLADRGVGEGSVVVWQLPTWIESFVLMGALVRLGATQVPLIPSYRAREVSFIIRQTGAEFFVVPSPWKKFDYPDMARTIAAEVDGLDVLVVDAGNRELPTGDPTRLAPVPPSPADAEDFPVRWVYFTSGTTPPPRAPGIPMPPCSARSPAWSPCWSPARGTGAPWCFPSPTSAVWSGC
jgi:cyclohexanecarboxylate-CoA ligase